MPTNCRVPGIDLDQRLIDSELIGGLYRRTKPLLIANLGALSLLTIALWPTADRVHLLSWAVGLAGWTMLRFALARLYLSQERAVEEVWRWTLAFAVGSGVAGSLWGSSIFLIGGLQADSAKLVTAFVMAALSAAAIAGYTNSLIAFVAFIAPALLPYAARLIWFDGTPSPMIGAFVVFWGWLLWSMARHLNDGFKEGVALTLQNRSLVDRLTKARDRAEAASLAKTRFLANMSHELRTPLNAIIGYSELMATRTLGPIGNPKYEPYAQHILDSGTHLLHVVNQVLDVSKLEAGKIDLTEDTIDVAEMLAGAAAFVGPAATHDQIAVRIELPPDLPHLRGDATKLRQAVLNLLSNAVKFTPAGGKVEIGATRTAAKGLAIMIVDTGVGIPPEDVERVTVPFAQLENKEHMKRLRALKNDVGRTSTGLGLPLAKMLAELHRGRLTLESQLGKGTTAWLEFPCDRVIERSPIARGAEKVV